MLLLRPLLILLTSVLLISATVESIVPLSIETFFTDHADILLNVLSYHMGTRASMRLRATCTTFSKLLPAVAQLSPDQQNQLIDLLSKEKVSYNQVNTFLSANRWYDLDFLDGNGRGMLYWSVFKQNSPSLFALLHQKGASITNVAIMKSVLECIYFLTQGQTILRYILDHGGVIGVPGAWNFLQMVVLMVKEAYYKILCEYDLVKDWINVPDELGRPPIFWATKPNVARDLIAMGADITWRDNEGKTAYEYHMSTGCALRNNAELMAYLSGEFQPEIMYTVD